MGTAEGLLVALEHPILRPEVVMQGAEQGLHVVPGRSYAISGLYFSGGCIDWVRRILLGAVHSTPEPDAEVDSYRELITLAESAPPGSGGVFFLPHLRMANPPINDPLSRGAFVGLSSDVTASHLARAVLEGLAYEYHYAYETAVEAFALAPRRIIVTGGGSRNPLLLRIKAALAGQSLTVPAVNEATCLGAAMLAGIATQIYRDVADATAQVQYATTAITPEPAWHAFYQKRYRDVYLDLYPTLQGLNARITNKYIMSSGDEAEIDG
jgi:xylulokinase